MLNDVMVQRTSKTRGKLQQHISNGSLITPKHTNDVQFEISGQLTGPTALCEKSQQSQQKSSIGEADLTS